MGVALMALPTMAQTFGKMYAEQPNAVFQSTSTMTGSGSTYSANPMLNSDGTASYSGPSYSPAKAPGGPHRAPDPINDDGDVEEYGDGLNTPLGDAVLPLLLCALAFCGVIYFRRRRSAA